MTGETPEVRSNKRRREEREEEERKEREEREERQEGEEGEEHHRTSWNIMDHNPIDIFLAPSIIIRHSMYRPKSNVWITLVDS